MIRNRVAGFFKSPMILLSFDCSFYFNNKNSYFLDTTAYEISLGETWESCVRLFTTLSAMGLHAVNFPSVSGVFTRSTRVGSWKLILVDSDSYCEYPSVLPTEWSLDWRVGTALTLSLRCSENGCCE